jgi:hypothetical protein
VKKPVLTTIFLIFQKDWPPARMSKFEFNLHLLFLF